MKKIEAPSASVATATLLLMVVILVATLLPSFPPSLPGASLQQRTNILRTLGWKASFNITTGGDPPPTVLWDTTYGGPQEDHAYSALQTGDGGYLFAGDTLSFGVSSRQAWLVRTNSTGGVIWSSTYGGTDDDVAKAVRPVGDGGFIVAGYAMSTAPVGYYSGRGAGGYDAWLFKVDSAGHLQWEGLFGGTSDDFAYDVQPTSDGGYVVVGETTSAGAGGSDVFLVKTDSAGDLLWNKTYGGTGNDAGYSIKQTSDGGYIIAGTTTSFGVGTNALYLIRTDSNGNLVDSAVFHGTGTDVGYSVVQSPDGGFAVAGLTTSYGSGGKDVLLLRTTPSLAFLWNKTYGGPNDDGAYYLIQAKDGGLALAGFTVPAPSAPEDVFVVKVAVNGDMIWNMTFGGSASDVAYSIQQTSDGGYILGCTTDSFGAGLHDAWLVNMASDFYISPFAHDGIINATVIVGNSDPHGPSGGAHTLDTVGGMMVAEELGSFRLGTFGQYFLDTDVATYNFTSGATTYTYPNVTNVITVGGPGVNMVTYHHFVEQWWNDPVYWVFNSTSGKLDIVTPSRRYYSSDWVGTGRDLALIESVYFPTEGRWAMMLAGFGGDGTRAACFIIQTFGSGQVPITLQGRAMLVQWQDTNGNAKVDAGDNYTIVEVVS